MGGQIYEAVGPQRLTQKELLIYMYALTTRLIEDETFHIKELMLDPEAFIKSFIAQKIKIGNLNVFHSSSLDRLERDSVTDTSEGFPERWSPSTCTPTTTTRLLRRSTW